MLCMKTVGRTRNKTREDQCCLKFGGQVSCFEGVLWHMLNTERQSKSQGQSNKEELGSLKTTQATITGSIWKSNWHIAHGYAEAFPPLVRT